MRKMPTRIRDFFPPVLSIILFGLPAPPPDISKPHEIAGGIGRVVDGAYIWTITREPSYYDDFLKNVTIRQL
jgi:hypothetical protein